MLSFFGGLGGDRAVGSGPSKIGSPIVSLYTVASDLSTRAL